MLAEKGKKQSVVMFNCEAWKPQQGTEWQVISKGAIVVLIFWW